MKAVARLPHANGSPVRPVSCRFRGRIVSSLSAQLLALLCWFSSWALVAQVPLKIEPLPDGSIRICWPTNSTGLTLQSSPAVQSPVWTPTGLNPEIVADQFCVTVTPDAAERFYRLFGATPGTMPVFRLAAGGGVSGDQLGTLLTALKLPREKVAFDERGLIAFVDPLRFQTIPTLPITDEDLIKRLTAESEDASDSLQFKSFDMEKLKAIKPLDPKVATDQFEGALREARLLPDNGRAVTSHTMLRLLDAKAQPLLDDVMLDTQVSHELVLGGIPLVGPGARITAAFDGEGNLSQMMYSFRKFAPGEPGDEVLLLPAVDAREACARLFPRAAKLTDPRTVYFAPSVLEADAQLLVPCLECGGTVVEGGTEINLLRRMVPATADRRFVPAVQLDASIARNVVTAKANAAGGRPPYRYQWLSSSVDLGDIPSDASTVEYTVPITRVSRGPERLEVIVTDANGVAVIAVAELQVIQPLDAPAMAQRSAIRPQVANVTDFGVERSVSDMGSGIQSGFVNRFKQEATKRFNFTGTDCWERDFRQGGDGLDNTYVDNVDLTFYIGHGWPGGFTFEGNENDGSIVPGDVVGDWGNNDMEWLALVSCQVLKWSDGGQNVVQRWGPAFDRQHMILGFDTNAHDWSGFGNAFAQYALGYDFGFFQLPPFPIRVAWFLAKRDQQPAADVAGAMGPIGPAGVHNCDEYFWGQGPVGPDISKANIQGWWVLYYQ